MSAENFLSRLSKVKKTGPGKWIARCPAHEDKGPSLSIKDDGGKVIMKCFAGCEVADIIGAVGVEWEELFPPNDGTWRSDEKRFSGGLPFTAMDALRCLSHEGGVVAICAADMAEGKVLSPAERDRLAVACDRIGTALGYIEANH
jgi:hypothetical protein